MSRLRELQLGFAAALLDGDAGSFDRHIRAVGLSGARRLQVYCHNTLLGLTSALEAVYPVVRRLVDEAFFRYAAARYIARHPSRSGNLHEFGEHFPLFLQSFPPTAELAYLPDVARLEWAYHQVFHAARHPLLDFTALAQIPVERQGELHFQLHPAARLLESVFPISRIWQVNQDDDTSDPQVDLAEGGVKLLIIRCENLDIEFQALADGEFSLLQALAGNGDFATACEQAMAAQPTLDLPACFHRHVLQGTLVDFFLPDS